MFAGVGERTREGNDLYREMIESGVIKLGDKARPAAPLGIALFAPDARPRAAARHARAALTHSNRAHLDTPARLRRASARWCTVR